MPLISEFTQKDYDQINRDYEDLKQAAAKRCSGEEEMALIQKAFEFANAAHNGIRRRSGEPYMIHPIAVAKIVVSDIGLGCKSIVAALLHDVVEDTDYTVSDIANLFGEKIASLVEGLTKIKTVLDKEGQAKTESMQAENFKRILLTLNDDVRVVLIKLADRLHNCRTIEFMPEYKRDKILSETMFIFIPLAHRLGLYGVKSEMEDIWLRYKEPEAFNEISNQINTTISRRKEEIEDFCAPIEEALSAAGFQFEIKKRVKTPYSIWHKIQTKGITFDQVYDLYAIRIIFNPPTASTESERDMCYHIFSIITEKYRYKPDRVRDWVKHPKNNGYEALHCTLMSNAGIWIEVQIRSQRMNDIAEKGIAAHWTYKKEGYVGEGINEMDLWINKIKEILVNPDVSALELLDIIHSDLVSTDIFVFTHKGQQKRIVKGATALDFAYSIHTEIGNKAIAAKVNMKLVPLSYVLRSGDQIEIITAENEHPKREWLNFLQTRRAKSEVLDYLKANRKETIEAGRLMLYSALEQRGYKVNDLIIKQLVTNYEVLEGDPDELFFRIAAGIAKIERLDEVLNMNKAPELEKPKGWSISRIWGKKESYVIDTKSQESKYIIASCCNPIPGDSVVGFLSSDGLCTVHKKSCPLANSMAAKFGDRIVMPEWAGDINKSFLVRLSLKGFDRLGMINEITRYVSLVMGVNIRRFNLGSEDGVFEGYMDVNVSDKEVLEQLMNKLNRIDGIQSVVRTEI